MDPAPDAPRPARRGRPAAAAALAVLAGVAWVSAGPVTGEAGSALRLPGVDVAVLGVQPEVMVHQPSMPAGMMPDALPEGRRRVALDVALTGRADGGGYDPRLLRLSGHGLADPVSPERTDLSPGRLPRGATVRGTLVFTVPDAAHEVTLTAVGGAGTLPLRVPSGAGHDAAGGH